MFQSRFSTPYSAYCTQAHGKHYETYDLSHFLLIAINYELKVTIFHASLGFYLIKINKFFSGWYGSGWVAVAPPAVLRSLQHLLKFMYYISMYSFV